jgi:hypothetical protein
MIMTVEQRLDLTMRYRQWTENEDARLREAYAVHGSRYVA